MPPAWKQYQEEACSFFQSLGLQALTDATIKGVRTTHDIDVLVKSSHIGFEITWLVECKQWKTPVSKLHVLALREIVSDVGADRGILLSEVGFQSGAVEAANLTNVQVTSLAALTATAENDILAMRLRELYDRVEACNDLYWDIPKQVRIDKGLRPEVGEMAYSGARVIEACREMLSRAFRGLYPIETGHFVVTLQFDLPKLFNSSRELVEILELMISDLESRLKSRTQDIEVE